MKKMGRRVVEGRGGGVEGTRGKRRRREQDLVGLA